MTIALGFALAIVIGLLAYRAGALDGSGAIAATAVGTAVFATQGWVGATVLLAFFIPASALSHLSRRAAVDGEQNARRNAAQVLANGGIAAVCAVGAAAIGPPFAAGFAGAFAAAAADTCATEIGMRFGGAPVSLVNFRRVAAGRSGGVTIAGTLASVAGAAIVAAIASAFHLAPFRAVAVGGVAGAVADSLLGATLQSVRWCPVCRCECEASRHFCGSATSLRRGVGWIQNDAVNVAATLCGAIVTMLALRSP
ncbi:MAG: DUF92 domain-containing protein [Candidatus Eremiobacteraeota bacterium]|nr:DUF92 domain-containing protein [Candidatus Eremiobacteraeota bacterium]